MTLVIRNSDELVDAGMESVFCDLCHLNQWDVVVQQRDLLLEVSKDLFTIVKCRNCGLVFLNPRPSKDLLASYYPTVYYPPVQTKSRPAFQQQVKKWFSRLKRWVLEDYYGYPSACRQSWSRALRKTLLWPNKIFRELKGCHPLPWRGEGKILDVGCGAGGNLKTLQEQGWDPYGIEISEVAAAHARRLVTENIHTGTLESAPFSAKSFDLVLMSHSLEHLPSPLEALQRIHRLLKDDGLLVVSVPNLKSLEFKLFGPWWFQLDPPRHFYHFEKKSLARALAKSGFRIHQARTAVSSVFWMASLDRFWRDRFQINVPFRDLIDRLVARPLSFIAGQLGYGTELTIHAVKERPLPQSTT